MYSAQDLLTAANSVVNGFRPNSDSVTLDVNEVSDVDALMTFALSARSLDEALFALERVLEIDSDNKIASSGLNWLSGVRAAAGRLEQAEAEAEAAAQAEREELGTSRSRSSRTSRTRRARTSRSRSSRTSRT